MKATNSDEYVVLLDRVSVMSDEEYKKYIDDILDTDYTTAEQIEFQEFVASILLQLHRDRFLAIQNKKLAESGLSLISQENEGSDLFGDLGTKSYSYKIEKI